MTFEKMPDSALIKMFEERHGLATIAVFEDGREIVLYEMVWGRDFGDTHAHITANWDSDSGEAPFEFFYTTELIGLLDAETRAPLFRFPI